MNYNMTAIYNMHTNQEVTFEDFRNQKTNLSNYQPYTISARDNFSGFVAGNIYVKSLFKMADGGHTKLQSHCRHIRADTYQRNNKLGITTQSNMLNEQTGFVSYFAIRHTNLFCQQFRLSTHVVC